VKIGFYDDFKPCILTDNGVIDISSQTSDIESAGSPQLFLERLIENWDSVRPRLEEAARNGTPIPLQQVQLRSPVPRPGKVIMGEGNYQEGVPVTPMRPLRTFFKSPDAVIGPDETVVFPKYRPVIFNHEAELAVVIGKACKDVSQEDALNYVFGYTTGCDVSARAPEDGEATLAGYQFGKSFDTFLPLGPAIATADEVGDPSNLSVKYYVNGTLRQNYNTSDADHPLRYMISAISHVMTLKPGDVIMAGTNHGNLGPLQDGDYGEVEIEKIGRSGHHIRDDMKRKWDPNAWRDPAINAANRQKLQGTPTTGTWPLTPPSK
jgi:2-keto-4-pentenoate hydratase/2-oxohepta-3-ene-1,7-dioic acid hydratase in catechol pathway